MDTFFTAWASVAPSLEEAIAGGPAALEQATLLAPVRGAVRRKRDRVHAPAAPERERAASPSPRHSDTPSQQGAVNLRAATTLNTRAGRSRRRRSQAFAQNPIVTLGLEDFTQTLELGNPLLAGLAPAAGVLQLLHADLPQRRQPAVRERRRRHARARRRSCSPRTGPNNEGFPSSGAGQRSLDRTEAPSASRSSTTTTCTPTPIRTSPAPASRRCAKPATRSYIEGKTVDRQPAGRQQSPRTANSPSREQNLFGEKYPSATLEALGLEARKKGKS